MEATLMSVPLELSISSEGWIPKALEAINRKGDVTLVVTGPAVMQIIHRVQEVANKLPFLDMWKVVQRLIPVAGQLPIDPTMIVPVLAAVGGLGGAAGSAAFVATVGIAHGMTVAFDLAPGAILDPTDDALRLVLTYAKK
jgi:hypothetical protein